MPVFSEFLTCQTVFSSLPCPKGQAPDFWRRSSKTNNEFNKSIPNSCWITSADMKNHPHIIIKHNFQWAVCLFVCLSVCLFVCLVCLFVLVGLFVCLFFSSDLTSTCPMLFPFPSCRFAAGCPSPVHPHGCVTVEKRPVRTQARHGIWWHIMMEYDGIHEMFLLNVLWLELLRHLLHF